MPYKRKPMTIITHLIGRLKKVRDETKNPTAVKTFAESGLNDIPWKVNEYSSASEVLRSILTTRTNHL